MTGIYRSHLQLAGVPAALASKARGSFAVAIHAGGPLRASASTAFTDGIHTGLLYAAAAAVAAAVSVAVLLAGDLRPRRPGRTAQPDHAQADQEQAGQAPPEHTRPEREPVAASR